LIYGPNGEVLATVELDDRDGDQDDDVNEAG
jgi:hypothetical protein